MTESNKNYEQIGGQQMNNEINPSLHQLNHSVAYMFVEDVWESIVKHETNRLNDTFSKLGKAIFDEEYIEPTELVDRIISLNVKSYEISEMVVKYLDSKTWNVMYRSTVKCGDGSVKKYDISTTRWKYTENFTISFCVIETCK